MRPGPFLKQLKQEATDDRIGDVAAMMTYYALFALFPMIVFVVTVGLLVMPDSVFDQGLALAKGAIPGEAGNLIAQQMGRMKEAAHSGFAIGSALLALWSASRGSASLSVALNDLYDKVSIASAIFSR